jgi:hypothetical protein
MDPANIEFLLSTRSFQEDILGKEMFDINTPLDKKLAILSEILELKEMPWLKTVKEKSQYLENMATTHLQKLYREYFDYSRL